MKRISKRTMFVTVAATMLVLTIAVSRRVSSAEGKRSTPSPSEAARSSGHNNPMAQGQPKREHRQLVRVFVHGDDIYPDVIRVRPGNVLLVAENETQSDIALVVESVKPGLPPQAVSRLNTPQRDKRSKQDLTLAAGEYRFYAETNPAVKGKLIVEPHTP